jgi:glutathione S-transferase
MGLKLYGIGYSPWTERARWALEHHGIDFGYREHVPYLGEPVIRFLYRDVEGKPSVPLLKGPNVAIGDSWEITRWADAHGSGESLRTQDDEVVEWFEVLDEVIDRVRVRVTRLTLNDPAALTEAATAAAPRFAAGLLKPVAAAGARHIAKKYGFESSGDPWEDREMIREVLDRMSSRLSGNAYLVGDAFSAADLIAATMLQGVRPLVNQEGMGPATRGVWEDDELAGEYANLLKWRDGVYHLHWRGHRHR